MQSTRQATRAYMPYPDAPVAHADEAEGLTLPRLRGRVILEMGAEQRYDIYDLFVRFPAFGFFRDRRPQLYGRIAQDI